MLDVKGIPKLERLFRAAAQLDVDKSDLQRYIDFVNQKIYDLLLRGQAAPRRTVATSSSRTTFRSPKVCRNAFTNQAAHEFKQLNAEIDLQSVLDHLAARPQLDLAYSDETEAELPRFFGGVSLGLARTFKIIEPDLKNPQKKHWEQAMGIFNLLL